MFLQETWQNEGKGKQGTGNGEKYARCRYDLRLTPCASRPMASQTRYALFATAVVYRSTATGSWPAAATTHVSSRAGSISKSWVPVFVSFSSLTSRSVFLVANLGLSETGTSQTTWRAASRDRWLARLQSLLTTCTTGTFFAGKDRRARFVWDRLSLFWLLATRCYISCPAGLRNLHSHRSWPRWQANTNPGHST